MFVPAFSLNLGWLSLKHITFVTTSVNFGAWSIHWSVCNKIVPTQMPRALDLFPRSAILALNHSRTLEWRKNFIQRLDCWFLIEDVGLLHWPGCQVCGLGENGRDSTAKDGVVKHSLFYFSFMTLIGKSSLLGWFFSWHFSYDLFCQVNRSWRMTLVLLLYLTLIHCIKIVFILLTPIPRMAPALSTTR